MSRPNSAANPLGNLAPRDFSILITDTQDRIAPHRVEEACDDAKCNELCYQRGGFVGGTCGDSGKCDCVEPSSGTGLRAQGGENPCFLLYETCGVVDQS